MEIPIPKYFTNENARILKERDKMLGTILAKKGPQDLDLVCLHEHVVALMVSG